MSKVVAPPVTHTGSQRVHIHGLNGLRALAVIFVVFYHYFPHYFPGGLIGVDIFFVISGYLITALLIAEIQRQGSIHFKKFWLRRIRRLFPALILMISSCAAIAVICQSAASSGLGPQLLGALTYTSNWMHIATNRDYFQHDTPELFTNLWSIAVEEQFYLFWPIALVAIKVIFKKWKLRGFAASVFALISALLMALIYAADPDSARAYYGTDTHAFGLMLGATIAFWNPSSLLTASAPLRPLNIVPWDKPIVGARKAFDSQGFNALLSLLLVVLFVFTLNEKQNLLYGLGLFTVSILSAKIIDALITTTPGNLTLLLHKILGNKKLVWLGERSYGIYLWHWPIYTLFFYSFPNHNTHLLVLTSAILLSVGIAALSYRFLEQPIRRYGFKKFLNRIAARTFGPSSRLPRRFGLLLLGALCTASIAITTVGAFTAPGEHSTAAKITENKKMLEQQKQLGKTNSQNSMRSNFTPSGSDIIVIGDSVVLGSAPEINAIFPDAYIDAEVSRSFNSGIKVVEQMKAAGTLRPMIVFALTTNGMVTADMIDSLVTTTGSEHQILLVTAYGDRAWIAPSNEALKEAAKNHPNVQVADWKKAITVHPEWLAPDKIHPQPEGAKLFADVLKAGINAFPKKN